jgi:hypothetical protein
MTGCWILIRVYVLVLTLRRKVLPPSLEFQVDVEAYTLKYYTLHNMV